MKKKYFLLVCILLLLLLSLKSVNKEDNKSFINMYPSRLLALENNNLDYIGNRCRVLRKGFLFFNASNKSLDYFDATFTKKFEVNLGELYSNVHMIYDDQSYINILFLLKHNNESNKISSIKQYVVDKNTGKYSEGTLVNIEPEEYFVLMSKDDENNLILLTYAIQDKSINVYALDNKRIKKKISSLNNMEIGINEIFKAQYGFIYSSFTKGKNFHSLFIQNKNNYVFLLDKNYREVKKYALDKKYDYEPFYFIRNLSEDVFVAESYSESLYDSWNYIFSIDAIKKIDNAKFKQYCKVYNNGYADTIGLNFYIFNNQKNETFGIKSLAIHVENPNRITNSEVTEFIETTMLKLSDNYNKVMISYNSHLASLNLSGVSHYLLDNEYVCLNANNSIIIVDLNQMKLKKEYIIEHGRLDLPDDAFYVYEQIMTYTKNTITSEDEINDVALYPNMFISSKENPSGKNEFIRYKFIPVLQFDVPVNNKAILTTSQYIKSIKIFNGNAISNENYTAYSKIKKILISFSDKTNKIIELQDNYYNYQTIEINKTVEWIEMKILDIIEGEQINKLTFPKIELVF